LFYIPVVGVVFTRVVVEVKHARIISIVVVNPSIETRVAGRNKVHEKTT